MSGVLPPRELVLASAGSGKTYRISSRLIGLLAHGEEPDRILAATFTRKAAGQILDKVLERLAEGALSVDEAVGLAAQASLNAAQPLPQTTEFWAAVLDRTVARLHRLNIGTLDAFFMRAATAFEAELGLPPGWRIPDQPTAARLRSRALLTALDRADPRRIVELLRLVSRGDVRRSVHDHLAWIIDQLLEIDEQMDPGPTDPWSAFSRGAGGEESPDEAGREHLAARLEALDLPRTRAGSVSRGWARAVEAAAAALRDGDWEALVRQSLCQKVASGEPYYHRFPIEAHVQACVEEVLSAARAALRPGLAAQIRALGELTRAYRDVFRETQHAEGFYGFGDITRLIATGDPLGERADLYYRLDSRTRHILLDEFQDTSHTQWAALSPLVDEVLSDDGRAAVVVADPKQSIYGWRGAEPDVVHAVGARYSLVTEHLSTSWRSSQAVLDFVNRIFERIEENPVFADDQNCVETASIWRRDFQPHRAQFDRPGHVRIEVGPADDGSGSDRPLLFSAAAERVAALRAAHPGATIGVLTRTNAAVARLFLELRQLGAPVSQEGGNPLTDSGACEAILALLRMADHPADTIARYHVAASPLGDVIGLSDHEDERRAHAVSSRLRRRLVADGYGPTVAELARKIVAFCDPREARRLSQLVELGLRYDRRATLRPGDFVHLAESERVEDRATADVRVMTVHQAKGLEFDIVVLPQLDDQIFKGGRSPAALGSRVDPAGPISAVYPSVPKELRCIFPELEAPYRQRRGAVLRDGLSTLYVGVTRARFAVHAIVAPDGDRGPGTAVTPARIVREALREPEEALQAAAAGATLYEHGDPNWYSDPHLRGRFAPIETEPRVLPALRIRRGERGRMLRKETPSQLHGDATVDVAEMLRFDNVAALDRGSIVHEWFEAVEWIDGPILPDAELRAIARRVSPSTADVRVQELIGEFRGWLAHPPIRALLSRARYAGAEQVGLEREVPFLRRYGDGLMEGVIDRLVVSYRDGRPVAAEVIDFKTDRTGQEAVKVARLVEQYGAQLSAYVEAVAELYGLASVACSATLAFLEAGVIESVPAPAADPPDPPVAQG
ncbi:MAG: UvrD-helicase domain-containing protein [Gemmatimonadota bacterium]